MILEIDKGLEKKNRKKLTTNKQIINWLDVHHLPARWKNIMDRQLG